MTREIEQSQNRFYIGLTQANSSQDKTPGLKLPSVMDKSSNDIQRTGQKKLKTQNIFDQMKEVKVKKEENVSMSQSKGLKLSNMACPICGISMMTTEYKMGLHVDS